MYNRGRGFDQQGGRRGRGQQYGRGLWNPRPGNGSSNNKPRPAGGVDNEEKKQRLEEAKKVTVYLPKLRKVPPNDETLLICYDTENSYGNDLGEIWQIGAVCNMADDEDKFSTTILPKGNIHWGVLKYSGVHVEVKHGSGGRKLLQHRISYSLQVATTQKLQPFQVNGITKEELPSVPPFEGLKAFVDWIKLQKTKHKSETVILLAHGGSDHSNFLNNLAHYDLLQALVEIVSGFGDTLPMIQNNVAAAFARLHPGETFDAHNAFADAEALFKILSKKQGGLNSKINLTEEITKHSVTTQDMLELSKFKVSSNYQKNQNQVPKGIHIIDALKSFGNLNQVKFTHKSEPTSPTIKLVNLDEEVQENKEMIYLAFDVQFLNSQGLRSEIVEISARDIENETVEFHVSCYAHDEAKSMKNSPGFSSVQDGIHSFLQWISDRNINQCILIQFNPHRRAWPGLLNHLCFYEFLPQFFNHVIGICDLKRVVSKEYPKFDHLEKLHKEIFKHSIELYRSKEVLESLSNISNRYGIGELKNHVEDLQSTLKEVQIKLNKSLGDDIASGNYYSDGHIGNFRISPTYFDTLVTQIQ